jgi:D-sedoheptulose 7-phosphate isomerase
MKISETYKENLLALKKYLSIMPYDEESTRKIMAYANDMSFSDIFVEQLKNYFKKGDVVFGISGSGNSMNVVKAIEYANKNGGISVSLTGYDGGKLMSLANYNVNIPIDDMQIAEDLHMILDHCMMQILYNE